MLRTWDGLFVAPPPEAQKQEVTSEMKFTSLDEEYWSILRVSVGSFVRRTLKHLHELQY